MYRLPLPLLSLLLSSCFRDLDVTFDTDEDTAGPDVSDTDTDTDPDTDPDSDTATDTAGSHDLDGDGWEGPTGAADDCNDDDATVYPGAYDRPDDGVDADCDGVDRTFAGVVVDEGEGMNASVDYVISGPVGLDIAFVFDTSCSVEAWTYLNVEQIADATPSKGDARWSLSSFIDYAYNPYGTVLDRPFRLEAQMTDDIAAVQAFTRVGLMGGGGDVARSGMEAMYQVLTGAGYDQDCDGTLDLPADIPPFIASSGDPFGGTVAGRYDATVSGTGARGGAGFRADGQPVVVLVLSDYFMRDPDSDESWLNGSPGGCSEDAGAAAVAAAAIEQNAWIVGIHMAGAGADFLSGPQFVELADSTGMYVDSDGDGRQDDAPVYVAMNDTLNTQLAIALEDVAAAAAVASRYELVELVIDDDPYGLVDSVTPSWFTDVGAGEALPFELQLYGISTDVPIETIILLSVVGDGVVIDTIEVEVEIAPAGGPG